MARIRISAASRSLPRTMRTMLLGVWAVGLWVEQERVERAVWECEWEMQVQVGRWEKDTGGKLVGDLVVVMCMRVRWRREMRLRGEKEERGGKGTNDGSWGVGWARRGVWGEGVEGGMGRGAIFVDIHRCIL